MESRKGTAMTSEEHHQVTLNVSFVQAIDKPIKEPAYQESYRDGQRKRIYEGLPPEHYFHYEYQLLPGQRGVEGQRFKTDAVCFGGVVTKVYTDKDNRVVQCWEENDQELNHFGWKHKHTFKVNKVLLLELYDHTLEVRVWTCKTKLSARARYDRPKAFRLPAADNSHKNTPHTEDDSRDNGIIRRPSKLPLVSHDQVRNRLSKRRLKQVSTLSVQQTTSNQSVQLSSDSVASVVPYSMEPAILEESKQTANQLVPYVPSNETEISSAPSKVLSRRALKKKEAELIEQARIEREGVAVLRIKMADIFSKDGSVKVQLSANEQQHKEIKQLEVGVSLTTPLMPATLLKELNPMTITITKVSGLPATPTSHRELRDRCIPAYIKYQFHTQPLHTSPGQPHASSIPFNNTHVILLGTIDPLLLVEYLRGPPLTVEVHDRDVHINTNIGPALFGTESRDDVLGTHAFAAGISHSSEEALISSSSPPWNHYGVAKLDLSGLLQGQRVIQITAPVINGPRAPSDNHHGSIVVPPGDYVGSQCELTAIVELTHQLSIPIPRTPLATPKTTPTRRSSSKAPSTDLQSKISPRTPKRVKTITSSCPFNRLVYVISSVKGKSLVKTLLTKVNELNAKALHLEDLPPKILLAALSTYKLTRDQMTSGECDIITGYHIEDWEQHVIVLEGLKERGIKHIWDTMPRHNTQDEAVMKVFYNSEFAFSSRLYACLDVDLPRIKFYQPLSELTQQSLLYIKDMIPLPCFRALMCLSEIIKVSEMADITRNNLLLSAEEVAALSLQFAHPSTAQSVEDGSVSSGQELSPDRPDTPGLLQHMPIHRVWEPLNMTNPLYETMLSNRPFQPKTNFIKKNILHTETLSQLSSSKKPKRSHQRSLSESSVPAHNYSTQTLNSTQLAHKKMKEQLDPTQRYTYCQRYHSMTVVPIDVEAERRAHQLETRSKWRTSEGFVYPGVKTARESNMNNKKPHPARMDDLTESFEDNLLHANTLKPTIQRDKLPYSSDFERWKSPPNWLAPVPPVTIHLAGQSRQQEVKEFTDEADAKWRERLVVDDVNFYTHRKGIRTELEARGPRAANQLDKLQDVLKSPPNKHTLRHSDFKLDPIPALSVVHNPSVDPHVNILINNSSPADVSQQGGYYPGPYNQQSLKRDCNVIPCNGVHRINHQRNGKLHTQEFRLNYHTAEVVSKRPILPLTQDEKSGPLYHHDTSPNRTTLEQST